MTTVNTAALRLEDYTTGALEAGMRAGVMSRSSAEDDVTRRR